MAADLEFQSGFGKILVRLSPLILLIVLALGEAATDMGDERPYEVGSKAIVFDARAEAIVNPNAQSNDPARRRSERVRVLRSTLENARGLVATDCRVPNDCLPIEHLVQDDAVAERFRRDGRHCDTQLLVVDAWEGVSGLCVEREGDVTPHGFAWLRKVFSDVVSAHPNDHDRLRSISMGTLLPVTRKNCPDEECLAVEHGGITTDPAGDIIVAQPHKDRVATFRLSRLGLAGGGVRSKGARLLDPEPAGGVLYAGRHGARIHDVTRLPAGEIVLAESGADPKDSGVRLVAKGNAPIDLISGTYAPHPIGVFFSRSSGRIYATDVTDGRQRWMYVERTSTGWSTPTVFWTVEETRQASLVLRHLTTAWDGSKDVVFASGPDGLYIIDPAGVLLAKYSVGRPLSGMDWGRPNELFFTAGRYVGMLRLSDGLQLDRNRPPATATPSSSALTPVTPDATPKADEEPKSPARPLRTPPKSKPPHRAQACICR